MTADLAIRDFATFLNASFSSVYNLLIGRSYTTDESSINDWLQANWEILIEFKILNVGEYMEIYGEGADFNGGSSRITTPDALPTHKIIVQAKPNKSALDFLNDEILSEINADFSKLTGFKDGFYCVDGEFNYVLVTDNISKKERVFLIDEISFELVKY